MRRLLVVLLTLSLISCEDPNNYTIDGKAVGFEDGSKIYIHKILDNNQTDIIDTVTVKNESFSSTFQKSNEQAIHFFKVDNRKNTILFFPENVDLKATIYKDSLEASQVVGSQQNDAYKAFNDKIREFNRIKRKNTEVIKQARIEQDGMLVNETQKENRALVEEEKEYKRLFVANNNNSLFSVMLLTEMVSRKEINATDAEAIANNFSPKIAASSSAQLLKRTINSMKRADIGVKAPDFSAPTPDGEMISLYDVLGKYTIIDFWASWCKPCRRENPNVVNVYNMYHDQGLNIISVSLDKAGQKDRWLKAIEDDKLTWHHVSNLKAWKDPVAGLYNVRSIPATFLLDENGIIIAKNLRGPALVNKMAALFGN